MMVTRVLADICTDSPQVPQILDLILTLFSFEGKTHANPSSSSFVSSGQVEDSMEHPQDWQRARDANIQAEKQRKGAFLRLQAAWHRPNHGFHAIPVMPVAISL